MDRSDALAQEAEELISRCKGISQRAATFTKRLVGESDALTAEVKAAQASIKSLEASTRELTSEVDRNYILQQLKGASNIINGLGPGGDLKRFGPQRPALLLRLLLGSKTVMTSLRRDQSMSMKEEYHAFRDRGAWIMLVLPGLISYGIRRADKLRAVGEPYSLTPALLTGFQCYLAWLSYFYLAMALRENVLLMNGSNIRSWWIQHHYWSAGSTLLLLSLPINSPTLYSFIRTFLMWSMFQAVVMLVQNWYQRRRMYTRIALGKNSAMDVVSGESSGAAGQLVLLYPMLIVLQLWEISIGCQIAYRTHRALLSDAGWLDAEDPASDLRGMRGVCFTGCIFAVMGLLNLKNTLETALEKRSYAKIKQSLSKASLIRAAMAKERDQ